MSDVLHRSRLTPSQQAARFHQVRFRANIEERARTRIPIQFVLSAPVPAQIGGDTSFGPIVLPYHHAELTVPGPTLQSIIKATCIYFRVSKTDLVSQRRDMYLVRARQVAAYLCQTLTPRSLPAIGRQMGDRDHTTILHAVRKIQGLILSSDSEIIGAVDTLTAELS